MREWSEIIFLTAGFALSIVAALIGAAIQRVFSKRGEMRPLNQLLNFGNDDLLFVFPHREEIHKSILPRTSTEDFIAMNNVISALIKIGWRRKISVRDPSRLSPADKKKNLVAICSPKSNEFSKQFQSKLEETGLRFFRFVRKKDSEEWQITEGDAVYSSESYNQEKQYIQEGCLRHDLPSKSFDDYAVITKKKNPWNDRNKVVMVAGIRGVGTWGAAECLKKEWSQIYDRLEKGQKDADFSALVRIRYDNCDITSIDVRNVIPFDK